MKRDVFKLTFLAILGVVSISVLFFSGVINFSNFTGFAVFTQSSQENFDEGTYLNTEYNGTAVILSSENLTGTYTSKVFDCGSEAGATWNSLTDGSGEPLVNYLYGVDGGGEVYKSSDLGLTWVVSQENYGRTSDTIEMFADLSYIYIVSTSNKEIWNSSTGEGFAVVNDTFADSSLLVAESDSSGNLYIGDASGDVYLSTDYGQTWTLKGDFNAGATNNAKGMAIDSSGNICVVDGSGAVFYSSNQGVTWTEQNSGYGGGLGTDGMEADSSGNFYILNNKEVYKSSDSGVTWSLINESFTPYSNDGCEMLIDSNDNFFVADCTGRIFSSPDSGVTWEEGVDMSVASSADVKGLADFSQSSSLSFQVRNCSSDDCSDGSWESVGDLSSINKVSRYFQFKVDFLSPDLSITPFLSSVEIDYDLVNTAPSLVLVSPQDGQSYGYNESLELNFTVLDADDNLDSCWYVLNSGDIVLISGCLNTTIDVPEGENTLVVYANDSLGEEVSDSAVFNVAVGSPTIVLNSPVNEKYFSSGEIEFTYTPTDVDLDYCELWGNFDGEFKLNQTEESPVSGSANTFSLNLGEGSYLWNVRCVDSEENFAFNGNKTFYVDFTNPVILISQPIGTKTSRTGISLAFSVEDDSPLNCFYSIFRGETIEKSNTSVSCDSTSTISVTVDADFVLYLYANDSAGNLNYETSEFSVDTSTTPVTPPSTGGGSGGGGGRVSVGNVTTTSINLLIPELKVIVYKGEEKNIKISVTNKGIKALNKCKVSASGDLENLIESNDLITIAAGEIADFMVLLRTSEIQKQSQPEIYISCIEGKKIIPLEIIYIEPNLNIELEKLSFKSSRELLINYKVNSDEEAISTIIYKLLDENGVVVVEESEEISSGKEIEEREFLINLPELENGVMKIAIYSQGSEVPLIEDDLVYDSKVVATGFISRELLGTGSWIALIVVLFGIAAFFMIRRILSHRRK